jgi:regulator of replication initiation timing
MAIVRPKFAAAEQKKRDVCIIGTGDRAELILVDAETGEHLAYLTNTGGYPNFKCDSAVRECGNYDLGGLTFDSEGRCVQFLKPDVAAMEAEIGRMKTEVSMMRAERSKVLAESDDYQSEVARLREENKELRSRGGDDESRMRWALEKMMLCAKSKKAHVSVYADGNVDVPGNICFETLYVAATQILEGAAK